MTTQTPTRYEALLLVAEAYGTQQAMAEALGVSQPTVCRWLNQSKQLPPEHVLQAEEDTGVSKSFLRPDIYPPEPRRVRKRFVGVDQRVDRVAFNTQPVLKGRVA